MRKKIAFLHPWSILIGFLIAASSGITAPRLTSAQHADSELFFIAQRAFEDGFYDVAIRYIEQLLNKNPQHEKRIQANLLLGQCYFFNQKYLKAFETFQKMSDAPGYQDAIIFWLAETHLKINDYLQARNHYKKLLHVHPQSDYIPEAYYALGWIHFEQKQYAQAKEIFLNFLNRFPDHTLGEEILFLISECNFFLSDYEQAINFFKKFLDYYPESSRNDQVYFYIAESHYYLKNYSKAITYYKKTNESTSRNQTKIIAEVGIGWSHIKSEEFSKAEESFRYALEMALSSDTTTEDAILGLANLFAEKNDLEQSLKYYNKFLSEHPSHPRLKEILLNRSNLLYALKRFDEALEQYQTIIELFPSDAPLNHILEKAYLGLGWTFMHNDRLSDAIKIFTYISTHTKNKNVKVSALAQIGDASQDLGNFEDAIAAYDQILKNFPNTPYTDYVQYRQGIGLLKMGKIESARLSFQSLQENFPRSRYLSDIDYYLGMAYFKKNDFIGAKESLKNFIQTLSSQHEFAAEAHYVLGLCYFYLNQDDRALNIFQKIKQSYPNETNLIPEVEFHIAQCRYRSGDVRNALREFKMIAYKYAKTKIALDALLWLGEYYSKTFDFDNAILFYQQIIDDFPNSPQKGNALLALGKAYFEQKKFDQALNHLKQIDKRFSLDINARAKLAIADIFAEQLDPNTAMNAYRTIIDNAPEFQRNAYVKIARLFSNKKDYPSALNYYQKALQTPESISEIKKSEIHFLIGDIYEILNDYEKAIGEYFKIPYLHPTDTQWVIKAYLRIAKLFENNEAWDKAAHVYQKIMVYEVEEKIFAQERLDWIHENVSWTSQ